MKDFKSKVAVVTGAGSGIGRAIAIALAEKGCHLAICDISDKGLEETRQILIPMGIAVSVHQIDVSDGDQVKHLAEEVIRIHRHVHILVNNAGVASGVEFENQSLEDFQRVMAVNLYGVVHGCKYFLPYLKKETEAHIVNTSSILGLISFPILSAYSTSKFAVRGFSQSLWHELREYNIGVTTLFPGFTKTNIVELANVSEEVQQKESFQKFKDKLMNYGILPERVAQGVIYGIRKKRQDVVTGIDTTMMALLVRFIPGFAFFMTQRLYRYGRTPKRENTVPASRPDESV